MKEYVKQILNDGNTQQLLKIVFKYLNKYI